MKSKYYYVFINVRCVGQQIYRCVCIVILRWAVRVTLTRTGHIPAVCACHHDHTGWNSCPSTATSLLPVSRNRQWRDSVSYSFLSPLLKDSDGALIQQVTANETSSKHLILAGEPVNQCTYMLIYWVQHHGGAKGSNDQMTSTCII